jgi:predicted transposase YbfD/YdcC
MSEIGNLLGGLLDHLQSVPEPRQSAKIEYPLDEILFLTISAVISGCLQWDEIVDFGEDKLTWLRQYRPFCNGIPSHDTMNRVISLIDPAAFEQMFILWVNNNVDLPKGTLISIDGKKLRSSATKLEQQTSRAEGGKSAVHLVEAWCSDLSLCLSIREVAEKTNEIKAIPLILNDLEIEGCVISIDAMGCQKKIVAEIISETADYVIGLKKNQPTLLKGVEQAFKDHSEECQQECYARNISVNHGRIEERICRILNADRLPQWVPRADWTGLNTIIQIKSERTIMANGTVTNDTRYYISSLSQPASQITAYIRGHWGIENQLHYMLDVFWGEDGSRKRIACAAANFGTILRIAHNLVKIHPENISIKRKQKKADRSDLYREQLLRLRTSK